MRRIALLLAAAMLTLVGTSAAATAQDPYGNLPTPAAGDIGMQVTVDAGARTFRCTVVGLMPGSEWTCTVVFQAQETNTNTMGAFDTDAAALAFVGAQAACDLTVTVRGIADANGIGSATADAPICADLTKPITASATGTAANGELAVAADLLNAPDPVDPETTPATGTDSGVLALVAAGALAVGAGALVATRRRKTEMAA